MLGQRRKYDILSPSNNRVVQPVIMVIANRNRQSAIESCYLNYWVKLQDGMPYLGHVFLGRDSRMTLCVMNKHVS